MQNIMKEEIIEALPKITRLAEEYLWGNEEK
jgi:hypothetical protein